MSAPLGWLLHFATCPWHAQRINFYVFIQHHPSTSYSSLMRRYSLSLSRSIPSEWPMFICRELRRNRRLLLTDSSIGYTSDLLQVTHGVRSPYQSWDVHCIVHSWYLWNPEWEWTARATAMRCMLSSNMLPAIRQIAGEQFIFQQDNVPAHRARDTVEIFRRSTPQFIAPDLCPPNSTDLNPVYYKIWGVMQEWVYKTLIRDMEDLKRRLNTVWSGV